MTVAATLAIAALLVWLAEIRHRRQYRERMEWLRYRAERLGILL